MTSAPLKFKNIKYGPPEQPERPEEERAAIFAHVAKHLINQMAMSAGPVDGGGNYDFDSLKTPLCAYRTGDGKACAVGCLITDELYGKYRHDIEGTNINHEFFHDIPVLPIWLEPHVNLLRELQRIHDQAGTELQLLYWLLLKGKEVSASFPGKIESFLNTITCRAVQLDQSNERLLVHKSGK